MLLLNFGRTCVLLLRSSYGYAWLLTGDLLAEYWLLSPRFDPREADLFPFSLGCYEDLGLIGEFDDLLTSLLYSCSL